ncbi:GlxA family transcriptional regulator [Rhizomonospora bruguierae]|uniref:GlxA family transcriptional regulator n=1 Tax=Rhizomonospora bruguierae TaxID=1581705 RepID=UPI001BCB807F|nr:helix-turn-helix domain-containing protein [Micromonospora sp. NBRC 107566]
MTAALAAPPATADPAPYRADRRHRIGLLALPDVVTMDLGVPIQLFGCARDADDRHLYRVGTCTPDGGPVRGEGGFQVLPDRGLDLLGEVDTVIVPGIHGGAPLTNGTVDPIVASALVMAWRRGARIMSICTSAAVLAAAGLLDGRPATTHWRETDRFRRHFPRVRLDPDVLFVDDGDVLTSAGVAAGIDLCLHVIRRDHGGEVANRAARRCVVPAWRDGGQAQFIERPLPEPTDAGTAGTRAWALERLDEPLTLAGMAEQARMSVRTFTRRFRAETGLSPARWLVTQRVERARLLLETTDLAVDQVAHRSGFGTAAALRQQMQASVGVSPMTYRRTFRTPAGVG